MYLISTRGKSKKMLALDAVLQGIAEDGGLFVPEIFPKVPLETLLEWGRTPYAECAARVLCCYFDIEYEEMLSMTREAYASFADSEVIPIQKIAEGEYVMELFHGPTLAFKDVALQLLPRLMRRALETSQEDALILTATSGDTGKAALEGFRDVPRTKIAVFYPEEGVSDMQKLQMTTQQGQNVYVGAIRGNFDDAQSTVKKLFADLEFRRAAEERGMRLSSANSINFGRLAPQIAYYIYSYGRLVAAREIEAGQKVNFVVPTGNFGNILAAYYAMRMGLPVNRLICASNKNNVLTDFLESGVYMADREFYKTTSPSMDILISSNLERLLFEIVGRDSDRVRQYMGDLTFAKEGYLMDTHTAVGRTIYLNYKHLMGDDTPTILAATASPFKFPQDVLHAITRERQADAFAAAEELARIAGGEVPEALTKLKKQPVRFTDSLDKQDMGARILENL